MCSIVALTLTLWMISGERAQQKQGLGTDSAHQEARCPNLGRWMGRLAAVGRYSAESCVLKAFEWLLKPAKHFRGGWHHQP